MTPLDKRSARRRDLYLKIHNTHMKHTSMSPAGFEPTISGDERPQTYALDCAANGTGFEAQIDEKCKEIECEGMDWINLAQNRNK